MVQPVHTIPSQWLVPPVTLCLLLGIPLLGVLPLFTWNGLACLRNHVRGVAG
ncbi:hypothetical protein V6x_41460 [Gimesia chilikensis]|uniref:Uncharacterized protein n=1 Tax=Gimesia chilikensis TaxID=2605989 RepID=A0A517WGN1_9PLAN|nr:hypothetical protein [Gimesia chilikensis]QDU04418.1 hypothetical protein V6x_41460 [Gimesia chilikensis]